MSVNLPDTSEEVTSRIQTDVKGELDNSNPWLADSFIRSVAVGNGNRIFDYYFQLKRGLLEVFPNTATSIWLQFWADLKNITPLLATPGSGPVTFTGGSVGLIIGATKVITIGSLEYTLDADATFANLLRTVSVLNASGTTATCVTDDDHNYTTGMEVTFAGANETEWNVAWSPVTVTGNKSFTFTVPLSVTSPATGTITVTTLGAPGNVTCTEGGIGTNQDGATQFTLQTPIPTVNDTVVAQFEGIQGGTNDETTEEYQARVTDRWQNPQTPFNPATIESTIKEINGNTRVWVHRVTPAAGAVTSYFVRDNDDTIIPSVSEVATAQAAVVAISPANTEEADIHTEACVAVPIDVTVSNAVPNTTTMREAIEDTIRSYYRGALREGQDHTVDGLKSAIQQTFDIVKGVAIADYDLDAPTTDTAVPTGSIANEGTVTVNL